MYKDIISYRLAKGMTQEHLLGIAGKIIENWMKKQPGFIRWEILKDKDGQYTDIVYWDSKEDARNSEKDMVNIPHAMDWYSCYEEGSISSRGLFEVASFERK